MIVFKSDSIYIYKRYSNYTSDWIPSDTGDTICDTGGHKKLYIWISSDTLI